MKELHAVYRFFNLFSFSSLLAAIPLMLVTQPTARRSRPSARSARKRSVCLPRRRKCGAHPSMTSRCHCRHVGALRTARAFCLSSWLPVFVLSVKMIGVPGVMASVVLFFFFFLIIPRFRIPLACRTMWCGRCRPWRSLSTSTKSTRWTALYFTYGC